MKNVIQMSMLINIDLKTFVLFAYWLFRHPYWVWGYMHCLKLFPGNSRKMNEVRLVDYSDHFFPLKEALVKILGQFSLGFLKEAYEISREITSKKPVSHYFPPIFDASNDFAFSCYVAVRTTQPSIVVETGVAHGISTYYILRALEKNGHGHLFSIDLPYWKWNSESKIGMAVPSSLRSRWTLLIGWSIRELKKLKKKVKKIDLFIHDSDHFYLNQKSEYEIALNWFGDHGLLISDDVRNLSLLECYKQYGGALAIVPQKEPRYIGFLKPKTNQTVIAEAGKIN